MSPSSDRYADDSPIDTSKQDRFSRSAFAERTAEVIATRKETSSLVVGIYGPWGDGKTSVLNMMHAALSQHADVVTIRFNPWHFETDGQLIRAFFDTLADSIGKKLATAGEKIGATLKKYGGLLSFASLPGDGLKNLGEQMSSVEIDDLKERLGQLLVESGKRIVVMIDDVDRLDRSEIHTLLKLVKLSASFSNTAYIVACDDEVVAASLGERYGAGGIEAGKQFMEKIIQVPLHLPNAESEDLRRLAFEGVQDVLDQNGISIGRDDAEAFGRHFIDGILPALATPRQVKRYINSIRFAVPLLMGEVDIVDQLLIEAVRVVYPSLYLRIRADQATYTGRSGRLLDGTKDREKQRLQIAKDLEGVVETEREAAKELLEAIFPRTKNMGYGADWDPIWSRNRKITSAQYFRRYFQYAVPMRDVSDLLIEELFISADGGHATDVQAAFDEITSKGAWSRAMDKLYARAETATESAATSLAFALAQRSEQLPNEQGMFGSLFSTRGRAATFIARAIRKVSDDVARVSAAAALMKMGTVAFAADCFRWCRIESKNGGEKATLSESEAVQVGKVLSERIAETLATEDLSSFGTELGQLLWTWNEFSPRGATDFLTKRFTLDPADALKFIGTFVGRAWGLETGLSHQADFDRRCYDAVSNLVEPSVVVASIELLYPEKVADYSFEAAHQLVGDEQLACCFVALHNHVQQERAQAAAAAAMVPPTIEINSPATPQEALTAPVPTTNNRRKKKARAR